jgi:8-oxo-dGTP pyrophosphatase MutT (NUDIX family)
METNKRDIVCINCGLNGHTSKNCNYPITSFGVILHKYINNKIYYIMVQRKDSLCFTEFVRGKYDLKNIKYILKLISNMTLEEQKSIQTNDFDFLWSEMWVNNTNNMKKEYNVSKNKFNKLKAGYKVKSNDEIINIDLNFFISKNQYIVESEWEFPKGRRKLHESDLHCALREFEEETNIRKSLVLIDDCNKQYEELFIGKNKLRYRNVFYLGTYIKDNVFDTFFDRNNSDQIKEIQDVKWLEFDEVSTKIKDKIEKLELFKRLHQYVLKTKLYIN